MRLLFTTSVLALAAGATPALAQGQAASQVFELGGLQVTAESPQGEAMGGAFVPIETLQKFQKESVDQALDLVPGAVESNSGGSRNERLIYIRGFDRFQTTISIDGIRVYLPADNRLDFGRFLTADLSQIQVAKGYVPVIDGPGSLGGAINLVTRKPSRPFEVETRGGLTFDGDGSYNGYTVSGIVGTRLDRFYIQASGSRLDRNHWALPDDFVPTAIENGGFRDNSDTEDWRVNVKAGFTPNATDEYALSFTRQRGAKGAPYHVSDPLNAQRFWDWPYWDIDSTYFLSHTQLGDAAYLKTRAFWNTFRNGLFAYDDAAQTRQTLPRAFRSYYDDKAYGGTLELGTTAIAGNRLKGALHYRRDDHVEYQATYSPTPAVEPPQANVEDTWSLAVEDTISLTPQFDLTGAVSYDWRRLKRAEDFTANAFVFYRLVNSDGWNAQAAATYRLSETAKVYASVSSRQRFPTVFERFSSRFGGAVSNPDLKPERALNFDVGGSASGDGWRVEAAAYYADLSDVIVSVPFVFQGVNVSQSRNVGDGENYGVEVSGGLTLSPTVSIGGNYTWLKRKLTDPNNAGFRPTGTPQHKLFAYADWRVGPLTLTPSVEAASKRWTVTSNGARYYEIGSYVTASFGAAWAIRDGVELSAGVKNLFDKYYLLWDGFPEEGRNAYVTLRLRR